MELGSGCNFLKGQLVQFPLYNYTFSDDQAVKEIMLHYSDSSSQKCNSPFSAWGLSSQAPPSAGTTRRADLRFVVHSNLIPIKMESASRRSRRARSISVALVYLSLSPSSALSSRFMEKQCRVSKWLRRPQIADTESRELRQGQNVMLDVPSICGTSVRRVC